LYPEIDGRIVFRQYVELGQAAGVVEGVGVFVGVAFGVSVGVGVTLQNEQSPKSGVPKLGPPGPENSTNSKHSLL
jgi:hypothetical protein